MSSLWKYFSKFFFSNMGLVQSAISSKYTEQDPRGCSDMLNQINSSVRKAFFSSLFVCLYPEASHQHLYDDFHTFNEDILQMYLTNLQNGSGPKFPLKLPQASLSTFLLLSQPRTQARTTLYHSKVTEHQHTSLLNH